MRSLALIAAAATLAVAPAANARLFWQTYGATVAAPSGGCAWNVNSDYFVPRHCDSCRYDLFSPCKTAHSISPACKSLHPIYGGYCTIYGPCHYRRQDHVAEKHCGCTPLKLARGPWHADKCRKHGATHPPGVGPCHDSSPVACSEPLLCDGCEFDPLPNVEPLGGETLGAVVAFPGVVRSSGGASSLRPTMPAGQTLPPPLGLMPGASGASGAAAGVFGN